MNIKMLLVAVTMLVIGLVAAFAILVSDRSIALNRGYYRNSAYGMMGNGMMGGGIGDSTSSSIPSGTEPNQSASGTSRVTKGVAYQLVKVQANDWSWTLSKNHLSFSKPIEFVVTSTEGTHGFSIMGTNISVPVTAGRKPQTIVWRPSAKGTYTIACNIYCGAGHSSMINSLVIS
jgi:cytochrome c oxidase subunit 2